MRNWQDRLRQLTLGLSSIMRGLPISLKTALAYTVGWPIG
jgi:hypothetical protein